MARGPASSASTVPGGCPSSVHRALRACCCPISSSGTVARVLSSSVVAWATSSSDVAPFLNRDWAMSSACSCTRAFSLAWSISTSNVRMAT